MKVLIIDDDEALCATFAKILTVLGHEVDAVHRGEHGVEQFSRDSYDVVFVDVQMPDTDGTDLLPRLQEVAPETTMVMVTGSPSVETVLQAFRRGAYDYIIKPMHISDVRMLMEKVHQHRRLTMANAHLRNQVRASRGRYFVADKSPRMHAVNKVIEKLAATDGNVLIMGESGTGKEVVARRVHDLSPRGAREFVAVDCSTLTDTLLESELFGHVRGAFTGAESAKRGLFELADGGTFFLDEVGNLSIGTQAKLLRVLQDQEIRPVGSVKSKQVDVRLIAATNADLSQAVKAGTFREDLFYRLSVFPLTLPPLRERREDIPALARYFFDSLKHKAARPLREITAECLAVLLEYDFPGNVRELENIIHRAVVVEESGVLRPESLPAHLLDGMADRPPRISTLREVEREHIKMVLEACGDRRGEAAEVLGIDRKTLYRKLKRYALGD